MIGSFFRFIYYRLVNMLITHIKISEHIYTISNTFITIYHSLTVFLYLVLYICIIMNIKSRSAVDVLKHHLFQNVCYKMSTFNCSAKLLMLQSQWQYHYQQINF